MNLLLVVMSGVVWVIIPRFGLWFTLLALLPSGLKLLAGIPPFQRTPFDWAVAVFLITAWIGYWAAYDKSNAWIKFWLIVTTILLYFVLSSQPRKNFEILSAISFCLGLGISAYFFLTYDYSVNSGKIALWWLGNRPQVDWPSIHHGYISGLLVITGIFATYWLWEVGKHSFGNFTVVVKITILLGVTVVILAFIQTMSRGIWAALACGVGVWLVWKITASNKFAKVKGGRSLFPVFTLIYIGAIIVYVYLGPAQSGGDSSQNVYGDNTRAELHERSSYFLVDYPFTGGGLNSFPGLYSQYMISIPFFYYVNSYNLFLDIGIEQGLIGGLSFVFIYFGSVWIVSQKIVRSRSQQTRFIGWLSLSALIVTIVHGLFYDYLYNGGGTILLLFPVGTSMISGLSKNKLDDEANQLSEYSFVPKTVNIRMLFYVLIFGIISIIAFNISKIRSIWYANLGAVQMSQVELRDFPTNSWTGIEVVPALETAEDSLHTSLQFDPLNRTANQRLGIISMLRRDFYSAVGYLETAHAQAPKHRGIIKSLGYSYIWLGDTEKAQVYLVQIPEAEEELSIYVWWWGTQGRSDLSENASLVLSVLSTVHPQH